MKNILQATLLLTLTISVKSSSATPNTKHRRNLFKFTKPQSNSRSAKLLASLSNNSNAESIQSVDANTLSQTAVGWRASALRDPPRLSPLCGTPSNKTFVCDPDNLLHEQKVRHLNVLLRSIRRSPCACTNCEQLEPGFRFYLLAVQAAQHEDGSRVSTSDGWSMWSADVLQAWSEPICSRSVLISYNRQLNLITMLLEDGAKQQLAPCVDTVLAAARRFLLHGEYPDAISTVVGHFKLIFLGYRTYCGENPLETLRKSSYVYIGVAVSATVLVSLVAAVLVYWCRSHDDSQALGVDGLPTVMMRATVLSNKSTDQEMLVKDSKKLESQVNSNSEAKDFLSKKDKPGFWRRPPTTACDEKRNLAQRLRRASLSKS